MKTSYEKTRLSERPLTEEESKRIIVYLLTEFDGFCNKNNLRYFLAAGTLLGAIRHKGFIPWDDDADIFMPREDYEKLLKFSSVNNRIDIISPSNDHGCYHPFPYAVIADNTTYMVSHNLHKNTGKGQFVDIFPLDNVPDDEQEKRRFWNRLGFYMKLRRLYMLSYRKINSPKDLIYNIVSCCCKVLNIDRIVNKMQVLMQTYNSIPCRRVGMLAIDNSDRFIWPKECFNETTEVEFEGHLFKAPEMYDKVLTIEYGDYMTPPPPEKRFGHHRIEIYRKTQ